MAATSSVQWPATPVPEEVKDLINLFFELGDTKDASAGPSMADKVFSHGGEMVRATGTVKGNERMYGPSPSPMACHCTRKSLTMDC